MVEGLAMLEERSQAGELYPLVRELVATGAVLMWPQCRFIHTTAGIAEAAARQWDASEGHDRASTSRVHPLPC